MLVGHVQGRVQERTRFQVLYFVTLGEFEAYFVGGTNREYGDIAIVPGGDASGHADCWVDKSIRLLANTHQQLAHDMRFPG